MTLGGGIVRGSNVFQDLHEEVGGQKVGSGLLDPPDGWKSGTSYRGERVSIEKGVREVRKSKGREIDFKNPRTSF